MSFLQPFSLQGKTALVNGADLSLGAEIASGLGAAGARILLCGADDAALANVAEGLRSEGLEPAGRFRYVPGTEDAAQALAAWVSDQGIPDILVDNTAQPVRAGWDLSFDEILADLKRTQLGLMLTTQHIGQLMANTVSGPSFLLRIMRRWPAAMSISMLTRRSSLTLIFPCNTVLSKDHWSTIPARQPAILVSTRSAATASRSRRHKAMSPRRSPRHSPVTRT
jgi:NAD(P)-dependent dehydrogenase (short-subunit alcohol dehydrogenase family)